MRCRRRCPTPRHSREPKGSRTRCRGPWYPQSVRQPRPHQRHRPNRAPRLRWKTPREHTHGQLSRRSTSGWTPSMSHAPSAALERRHSTIRDAIASRSLDALVVTSLPNVLYLTNFIGSAAVAVLTPTRLHFLTDFRYVTSIADSRGTGYECPNLELVTVEGSYDATLVDLLSSLTATSASGD